MNSDNFLLSLSPKTGDLLEYDENFYIYIGRNGAFHCMLLVNNLNYNEYLGTIERGKMLVRFSELTL